jgi:phage-related minor tail protein
MATTQVSIRLGVEGKAEVKRAFDEVGKAGQDAFRGVATSMDAAGTAADRETQRLQRLAQAAKQAAAADQAQRSFNAALGVGAGPAKSARESAAVFEETARAAGDLAARTAALRAQIDPLGTAQTKLNAEIAEANALFKAGAITAEEQAAAHALAQSRFNATARSLGAVAESGKLTTAQLTNLGFQLNDVVVSLAGGQRPLLVLTQQGSQIAQIFGPGAGVTGILRGVYQGLTSLISPTAAVAAGFAAIGAAASAAYFRVFNAQAQLEIAVRGAGRAIGLTAGQIKRIADESASAGKISVNAAEDMAAAFLQTGKIGASNFGGLIKIVKDFATTTGAETKDAVKELAQAFADPVRGADSLNERLNFLDDRTRRYIRTLAEENDRTGAQRVLLDALKQSLASSELSTTALGRAWESVSRSASNAFQAIGQAISRVFDGAPIEERLRELSQERARLEAAVNAPPTRFAAGTRNQTKQELAETNAEIAKIEARLEQARQHAIEARANELSIRAGDTARELAPGFKDLEQLKAHEAELRALLNDPAAARKAENLEQIRTAYAAVANAINTYLVPAERARRLDELDIKALEAKTPAQKEEIAAQRKRLELAGQVIAEEEAEAQIKREGAKARAEAVQSLKDEAALSGVNAKATQDLASATLQNAAAAETAEARRKALTEAVQNGVDVETRMRDLLRDQVAEQAAAGARQALQLGQQAAAQSRLNDAVLKGAISGEQAQQQLQAEEALRPLLTAQSLAEGQAKGVLAQTVDRLRGAYAQLFREQARAAALQTLQSQRDQTALLQRQIDLVGRGASQQQIVIAELRTEQELRQKGIALASEEGRAIVANAGNIERLSQSLSRAQAGMQVLESIVDSVFDHFATLISEGKLDFKSFADAGRAAIAEIEREMLRLAILNPLKNLLFGTNLPTVSTLSGLFGSLIGAFKFHEGGIVGQGGTLAFAPAAVFANAPRFHGGTFLSPDEVPAILQRGERVLSRDEVRRYNDGRSAQANVYVTIQTPSPAAFQASRTQVAADLARAVRMGMRGM